MSNLTWQEDLTPVVRRLQVIVGPVAAGAIIFLVIVLVNPAQGPAQAGPPVLAFTAMGFAVTCLIVRAVVPGLIVAAARRKILRGTWWWPAWMVRSWLSDDVLARAGDAARLWQVYVVRTVVAVGVLEGAAFFLLVAYMIEGSLLSLIAAVLLILAIATHMPTRGQLESWTQDQLKRLKEQRQFDR